jgi:hypothetical protein
MRRFATPGLHDIDYALKLKRELDDHSHSFTRTSESILTFLTRTIPILTRESADFINPFYSTFTDWATSLAKILNDFSKRLQPLFDYLSRFIADYAQVGVLLDSYQGTLLAVRKVASEAAIGAERESLLAFVDALVKLNKDSNQFPIAVLTLYSAACRQAVYDLTPLVVSAREMISGVPEVEGVVSEEDTELAEFLTKLEGEIDSGGTSQEASEPV